QIQREEERDRHDAGEDLAEPTAEAPDENEGEQRAERALVRERGGGERDRRPGVPRADEAHDAGEEEDETQQVAVDVLPHDHLRSSARKSAIGTTPVRTSRSRRRKPPMRTRANSGPSAHSYASAEAANAIVAQACRALTRHTTPARKRTRPSR